MEYTILSAIDMHSLVVRVSDMIKTGWKPQGGVSFELTRLSADGGGSGATGRYLQAMVKKGK